MFIDTKNAFSNITGGFMCKPVGRIMTNPIMVATLITLVIMIIVEWTHDNDHRFRTGFRIFSILVLAMFGNNHIIMGEMEKRRLSDGQRDIINDISSGTFGVGGQDIVRPGGDDSAAVDDVGLPDVGTN